MRRREMLSVNPGEAMVDLFCGGGGWTALAEAELGLRVDAAVNHDAVAIEYHAKNYPRCLHFQGDAWETPPASVMAGLCGRRRPGGGQDAFVAGDRRVWHPGGGRYGVGEGKGNCKGEGMNGHTPDYRTEMAMVLERIDQWMSEKGYLKGHRTGELLKEAAAEITKLRARVAELEKIEAEAKAAGLLDEKGKLRKIDTRGWDPGEPNRSVPLPVYADGELWMMGEECYTIYEGKIYEFYTYDHNPSWTSSGWVVRWGDGEINLNKCYSTPEAAEAALAAKEGGAC